MFSAYFDASGNGLDQPVLVMSGYIANYLQWQLLESSSKGIHATYGVKLPFHASDLIAATGNPNYKNQKNAREDYVELAKDPRRAEEFFRNVAIAELTIVNCAVTCIVPMKIYNEVNSVLDLRQKVPPYTLAARSCVDLVKKWETAFGVPEPVECIFEEGDLEQGTFTALMSAERLPDPIYKKKEEFAGLQAADHYAWERAYFCKRNQRPDFSPRLAYRMLVDAIPKLHIETTLAQLINVCHIMQIDPRTGLKPKKL